MSASPTLRIMDAERPDGAWIKQASDEIFRHTHTDGAVLLRGLTLRTSRDLAHIRDLLRITRYCGAEEFLARSYTTDMVTTPLPFPKTSQLCPFQEFSFSRQYPRYVLTACIHASTPNDISTHQIVDTKRIIRNLPRALVARLRSVGWRFDRNFHAGFGVSWIDAFNVTSDEALHEALGALGIEYEWRTSELLATTRRLPAMVTAPDTEEECWFNDIAFFNIASVDRAQRTVLQHAFGSDVPATTYYGDGIAPSVAELEAIRNSYDAATRRFSWRAGDLLIADNLSCAQGREATSADLALAVAFGGGRLSEVASRPRATHERGFTASRDGRASRDGDTPNVF